jgi:hypothetical protein
MGCNASKLSTVDVYELESQPNFAKKTEVSAIRVVAPATPIFGGIAKSQESVESVTSMPLHPFNNSSS